MELNYHKPRLRGESFQKLLTGIKILFRTADKATPCASIHSFGMGNYSFAEGFSNYWFIRSKNRKREIAILKL